MKLALQVIHFAFFLVLTAAVCAVGFRVWRMVGNLDQSEDMLHSALGQLDITLQMVNRPCGVQVQGALEPCGTLAEIGKTTVDLADVTKLAQLQLSQSAGLIRHESASIDQVTNNVNREMVALQETTVAARGTALQATADLQTMNRTIAETEPLITNANSTMTHLDAIVAGPQLAGTLANLNATTANLAATTGDFQRKFHAILFPARCRTKWCKVKRAWPYFRDATETTEPMYWGIQIYKGANP